MINTERFWRGMCPHSVDKSVDATAVSAGMRFLNKVETEGVTASPDITIRNKGIVFDWPIVRVTIFADSAFYLLGGSNEQVAFDTYGDLPISLLAQLMLFADDAEEPDNNPTKE